MLESCCQLATSPHRLAVRPRRDARHPKLVLYERISLDGFNFRSLRVGDVRGRVGKGLARFKGALLVLVAHLADRLELVNRFAIRVSSGH
jgi:hypothetical protein